MYLYYLVTQTQKQSQENKCIVNVIFAIQMQALLVPHSRDQFSLCGNIFPSMLWWWCSQSNFFLRRRFQEAAKPLDLFCPVCNKKSNNAQLSKQVKLPWTFSTSWSGTRHDILLTITTQRCIYVSSFYLWIWDAINLLRFYNLNITWYARSSI